jgi:hypothetical protein
MIISKSLLLIGALISTQFLPMAQAEPCLNAPAPKVVSESLEFELICTPEQEAKLKTSKPGSVPCLMTQKEVDDLKGQNSDLSEIVETSKENIAEFRTKLMDAIVDQELKISAGIDRLKKDTRDGKLPERLKEVMIQRARKIFSIDSLSRLPVFIGMDVPLLDPKWLAESGGIFDRKSAQTNATEQTAKEQKPVPAGSRK